MPDLQKWWSTWAPYWTLMEERHFGTAAAARYLDACEVPVLVVGAGTGLIVQFFRDHGIAADGVDLDPEMVRLSREVRGLDIVLGDAMDLPMEDSAYGTVVIPSGVVDYMDDPAWVGRALDEALRVLRPGGRLIVGFYALHPVVEAVNRRIGVVRDGRYHMKRLFEIMETVRDNPLKCVPKIASWSGRSVVSSFLYWTRLGLFLPRELKEDRDGIEEVLAKAGRDGVTRDKMIACVPESLPYRTERDVRALLEGGVPQVAWDLDRLDDCVVAVSRKPLMDKTPAVGHGPAAGGEDGWFVRTAGLCKRYDPQGPNAVDSLDLAVREGEIFGILGPNGAGKTTTLAMLSGLMEPDRGSVEFGGGIEGSRIRESIGYVPQELALYSRLTGRENLRFFGRLYGVTGARLAERIERVLELVGLTDRAHEPIERYSTGMTRRLNLAAGLVHEPRLLLLDEPTVGIDPQSRNRIFDSILDLRDTGVTILYTTHYMEEVSRLCDRIAIMDRGRVLLEGEPGELVKRHGHYRVEFSAEDCPPAFAASLEALESVLSVEHSGHLLAVITSTDKGRMELVEEIGAMSRNAGVTLSLRRILEPDLESLFLDITGRSLKDGVT